MYTIFHLKQTVETLKTYLYFLLKSLRRIQ